jgi:ribonuclease E
MANKMLIDAAHPEETRVVVLRGNRVEEFDFESANRRQLRGNIYLAKVTRVEPSLQAAFVDYGGNRHGFLAFSEIHPDYYQIPVADRQALLEEEERAHRESEEEAERRSQRRTQRAARNADSTISEDAADDLDSGAHSDELGPADAGAAASEDESGHDEFHDEFHGESAEAAANAASPVGEPAAAEFVAPYAERADLNVDNDNAARAAASDESHDGDQVEAQGEAHGDSAPVPEGSAADSGNESEAHDEDIESVGGADAMEEVQARRPRMRRQYKIQEVIKRRQIMLVQVVKEERGTKGAALTTYLSLAGRYSVLMPNTARGGGISRKITNSQDRARLKEIAQELEVPEGMGVILRTAGAARTKSEVKRDFEYLLRVWENVRDLTLNSTAPTLVYEEGSLVKRSIRDLYNKEIDEITVAGASAYQEAKDFMRMLMPSHSRNVKFYGDTQPLFSRYGIETQLDAMFSPTVQLRSGGYIVLNQTEALVSIDVNSGRATREHHIEDTALKTNLEAAEEIARQLRLRDLAGLIVIDFIDMDESRNNRSVERRMKECLKNDRARIQVGRISHFGLLEMSRQRIRASVLESSTDKCPHCGGTGHIRSVSSVALQLLRVLEENLLRGATHNLNIRTKIDVALYLLNHKRGHLRDLEERFQIAISVDADNTMSALQPFVIDRGEQVHSSEQARAIAARSPTPPPPAEVQEDMEAEEEFAAEEGFVEIDHDADATDAPGEPEHGLVEGDGRRGGRRRRRRGRRGGSEPREAARSSEADPSSELAAPGEPEAADEKFEASAEGGETGDQNEPHRRRRRGRRGGRRNRRGREGEALEISEGTEPMSDAQPPETVTEPEITEPEIVEAAADLDTSPAPTASAPTPAPSVAEAAPPRKRSTVREPVPSVAGSSEAPSTYTAPPAPAAPETPASEPAESGKPRRTGWWAKRLLGDGH